MPVEYLETPLPAETCAQRLGAALADAAEKTPGLEYRQHAEGSDLLLAADLTGRAKMTVTIRPGRTGCLLRVEMVFGRVARWVLVAAAVLSLIVLPLVGYLLPQPIWPGTPNVLVFGLFGVLIAVADVVVLAMIFQRAIRSAVGKIADQLQAERLTGTRRLDVAETFRGP
jgi:hypothetical protein